jgi:hypothetical protein
MLIFHGPDVGRFMPRAQPDIGTYRKSQGRSQHGPFDGLRSPGNGRGHVAEGDEHVAQQREIIAKIKKRGSDPTQAKILLRRFEQIQTDHIAHCDRLEAML